MQSKNNVFLLAIGKMILVLCCIILQGRIFSEAMMWCAWKIKLLKTLIRRRILHHRKIFFVLILIQFRLPDHNLDTIGGDDLNGEPYDYVDDQKFRDEVNIQINDDDEDYDTSQDENLSEAP